MDCDFLPALIAAADGHLGAEQLTWRAGPSVCVVLASAGYPGAYESGKAIRGIEEAEATLVGAQTLAEDSKRPVAVLLTKSVLAQVRHRKG